MTEPAGNTGRHVGPFCILSSKGIRGGCFIPCMSGSNIPRKGGKS